VALADEDEEGRAQAAVETSVSQTYSDYREMLEREDLDIVSVCPRWVDCHEEMITAALEAGCHVYSEKPMTATPDAADRIIALADSRGLKIAVAHQAAYLPQIHAIRTMVDEGRIGKIVSIRATGKMDQRGGGEDLIVLGTHLFNLMRLFAGEVSSVWGRVTVEGRDIEPKDVREAGEPIGWIAGDAVLGFYVFASGATATFESRKRENRDGRPFGMEIRGESGSISFNADARQATLLEDDTPAPWEVSQVRSSIKMATTPLMTGNTLAIEDLVRSSVEDRDPISSARDARAALEMILATYASQVTGSRISLPLEDRGHPLASFRESR